MKHKSLFLTFFIFALSILNCTGVPTAYAYDPMCEFYEEHNGECCSTCHDMVSCATTNLFCVPSPISTPNSGEKPVVYDSPDSQVKGEEPYNISEQKMVAAYTTKRKGLNHQSRLLFF